MAATTLVVDDDPALGASLRDVLQGQPVEVVMAASAQDAIALMEKQRFCGLILDLVLDESSGFDVLHHLERNHITIPTVIVSGKLPSYVRELLSEEQVKLVFPKPVETRLLATIVLGLCGIAA
ncbi:MAG TPA: response regulator [Thermoanaerobaculia bacterium]|nr:response regulator [Thermoanaerobaculia bacterium]